MHAQNLFASTGERKRPLRLHGTVARDIGIRIVAGRITPGRVLEGEIAASERLKVSRTAYREAVRILAAKGLVEVRPKRGTRVTDPSRWHLLDPDVISWIFTGPPDERLLQGLFELRSIVEPAAAALAAERRSALQLEALRDSLERMTTHSLAINDGQQADCDFHQTLLEASGNPFLVSLTSGVAAAVTWTTIFKQRKKPLPRDPLPDHERVYRAVASRNTSAARDAMTELVSLALLDTTQVSSARRRPRRRRRASPA
jgi:DNA-binding FadR family transcriptional regulator